MAAVSTRPAPLATYRLQLGAGLDFAAAADLVPYLASLGVTHLYLSPVLAARPRSTHGYDVADPTAVSAALGGEDGLRGLARRARQHGLGLVVDIVPNHVGTGADTPLWDGLLAGGRHGAAGRFFDVDWDVPLPQPGEKVLLPVLGDQYGAVLHAGELTVTERDGTYRVRYHDHDLPVAEESAEALTRSGGAAAVTGTPGDPDSWTRLHALLEAQHYRLLFWRTGEAMVNYRRFFSINELAAVRVEDHEVFEHTHARVLGLVDDGVVDGLRVDHPDGLRDPARYFARLADRAPGAWIVAEKILEHDETLAAWPVAGTTGYEFASDVAGLFVDPSAGETLDRVDAAFEADPRPYAEQAYAAKLDALDGELLADTRRVARRLWVLTQRHLDIRDVDDRACLAAVRVTVAGLPVYRTYVDPETGAAAETDRVHVAEAVRAAGERSPETYGPLCDFLGRVLVGDAGREGEYLDLIARFQQLSAAATAKGVEDTVFYRYRRLLARNEVGADPSRLAIDVGAFHRRNAERAARQPAGMLTTATHDTKRGEDVRLRMAALSELADDWAGEVTRWREVNAAHRVDGPDGPWPDPQTEYLLYQTLVGVWPGDDLVARLSDYVVKAAREAGQRTDWRAVNADYERATVGFVEALLDPGRSGEFLERLGMFSARVREIGVVAGLAQTLLRVTSPGVPDTYQGNEWWDGSLVDPDNRRPVDYAARRRALAALDAGETDVAALLGARHDGRVKQCVLSRALRTRRDRPDCYGPAGGYQPLDVHGRWRDHVVAFARTPAAGDAGVVTVAPRLPGAVIAGRDRPPLAGDWADTVVALPTGWPGEWTDVLCGAVRKVTGEASSPGLPLAAVFGTLPVALLTGSPRS